MCDSAISAQYPIAFILHEEYKNLMFTHPDYQTLISEIIRGIEDRLLSSEFHRYFEKTISTCIEFILL